MHDESEKPPRAPVVSIEERLRASVELRAPLPKPPVPGTADLRDFPYTPILRSKLFGSSFHARATDTEWRAGVTLWLKSWEQSPPGSLPTDDIDLCRLAELGRDLATWQSVKTWALHNWYLCDDGRLYHRIVAEVVNEALNRKEESRLRTLRGRIAALQNRIERTVDVQAKAKMQEEVTRLQNVLSQTLSQKAAVPVTEDFASVTDDFGSVTGRIEEKGIEENRREGKRVVKSISTPNGVEGASAGAPPPCPHQQLIALYHEVLPNNPRIREWTETRRGYLQARWREKFVAGKYATAEDGLRWWRKFFAHVAKSKFLIGGAEARPGRARFVADLEWLVRPQNFARVIEGKYHGDE
jgi:hypothetical protein